MKKLLRGDFGALGRAPRPIQEAPPAPAEAPNPSTQPAGVRPSGQVPAVRQGHSSPPAVSGSVRFRCSHLTRFQSQILDFALLLWCERGFRWRLGEKGFVQFKRLWGPPKTKRSSAGGFNRAFAPGGWEGRTCCGKGGPGRGLHARVPPPPSDTRVTCFLASQTPGFLVRF